MRFQSASNVWVAAFILFGVGAVGADFIAGPVPHGLGVNIHFTQAKPGEMDEMAAAGIRIVRMDFVWAATEKTKGVYDFSKYDGLLKDLDAHGIKAWFILDYSNPVYQKDSPSTDEARAAFAKWAAAAVTHFKGHDIVWEMWNEPNGEFWKPKANADDYAKLSLATGKAVHAALPGAAFVGPGTSGVDLKFIEACFKAGCLDDWSAVSVHPYRQTGPESALKDYDALRVLIAKYSKGRVVPLLSGEWGYSVAWKNFSDARQADFLARQWLFNAWQQVPISIWYDWHDDGTDPKDGEHHFGIVRHDPSTKPSTAFDDKPSYDAAKTLTTVLAGYQCLGRVKTEQADDYVLLFSKGDDRMLAVWTAGKTSHDLKIAVSAGPFEVTSMTGERLPALTAGDHGLIVTASSSPIYLRPVSENSGVNALRAEHP